ncbi:putative transporter MCH4 [Cyberlindnera fabianii]|uniref:Putative transporter MCH4 n=1 Tax=Cyberlindnera fabianii TaxID=36022 RepID=A0A1V2LDF4_CYBFA|nr:putative transporter MCH4 [Cyberlindnera fabianii]
MPSIELHSTHKNKTTRDSTAVATSRIRSSGSREPSIVELSVHPSDRTQLIDDSGEDQYPEGGARAYISTLGSFLGLIPTYGVPNSVGAIEAYISTHQLSGFSASTVAWIFSIYSFFSFASAIFSGALFDSAGARKPMMIGSVCFVGGLFGTAFSTEVWHFVLAFGLLTGFGTGMLMAPLIGVVSHYFLKRRATFTSLATLGASVGGISIPLMLRAMYPTIGFKAAIMVLASVCAVLLAASMTLCKERIRKPAPEVDSLKSFIKVNFLDIFDYKGLRDKRFSFCVLAIALTESALMVTSIYIPSYAVMRGYPDNTGILLVTISNTTGVIGRLLPSYISDLYFGPYNTSFLTLVGAIIIDLALWLPFGYSLGVLYAFAALHGFFSGSALTISPVCVGQISRTEDFGKRFSTAYMLSSFSMLASIPIAGVIIGDGALKHYNNYIVFAAFLAIGSAVSFAAVRVISVGWKLSKF